MSEMYKGLAMHRCLNCGGDHMSPFEWEECGPDHWKVLLYCGNCETFRDDIFHDWECQLYDEWLDDCMDEITDLVEQMEEENMKESVARFTRALEMDIIMPEDF
jgi:hypothetical protein